MTRCEFGGNAPGHLVITAPGYTGARRLDSYDDRDSIESEDLKKRSAERKALRDVERAAKRAAKILKRSTRVERAAERRRARNRNLAVLKKARIKTPAEIEANRTGKRNQKREAKGK